MVRANWSSSDCFRGSDRGDGKNRIVSAPVYRAYGSTGEVSVQYTTITEGGATAGADFAATSGTLTWADGDALAKRIDVEIFDDAAVESDECFRIRLSNPTGGVTIRTPDQIVVIQDNRSFSAEVEPQ